MLLFYFNTVRKLYACVVVDYAATVSGVRNIDYKDSVTLSGEMPTTESDFAVSCPQQSQTMQCPALNRVRLSSVLPSTESDSAVSCPQQSQTSQCPALSRVRLHSVLPSAESDYAVSCPQQS